MIDPITELVRSLDEEGKPPFAWVVRWSAEGIDPMRAAWARSWSSSDMARLLERVQHPDAKVARRIANAPILWSSTDADRARCDAIRRAVPVPPSLAEVLGAWRARSMLLFAVESRAQCA